MAKKSKFKLPKRIAGVKVPKGLRNSGRSVARLVRSPLGREILADAVVAAAGAAAATLVRHRPSAKQVADAGSAAVDAGASAAVTAKDVAQAAVGAVGGVLADVARQALSPSRPDEDRPDTEGYTVLAADRAAKKAKHRDKPSKH